MGQRSAADSYEAKMQRINQALWDLFSEATEASDVALIHTFPDAVIIKDYFDGQYMEMDYAEMDGKITFGEPRAVNNIYVTKRLLAENPRAALKDLGDLIAGFETWAGGTWQKRIETLKEMPDVDNPEALCTWLQYQATGTWPGEKAVEDGSAKSSDEIELTGPIVMKNAAKRIAYAAVLVPGEIDFDGESVTAEKIEEAAHEWMELYQNVDLQHTLNNVGRPVESYLLPKAMDVTTVHGQKEMTLPVGTWILGSRLDEATWKAVEKGDLTGYSVMGMKRAAMKTFQETIAAGKSTDGPTITAALKKTLLRDLGPDWVPVYVSVVSQPAVPKAKFFALKAKEAEKPENTGSIMDRIKAAIGIMSTKPPAEKEGRRFAKGTVEKLRAAAAAILALVAEAEEEEEAKDKTKATLLPSQKGGGTEMNEVEMKEAIATAIKEATEPLVTRLTELEEGMKAKVEPGVIEPAVVKEADQEPEDKDGLEAFKTEINVKIDALTNKLGGTKATALKGQDGDETNDPKTTAAPDRDIYGRKRRVS